MLLRRLTPLTFLIRVRAFRDPLRGELPHVQIFMNDGPNPLTWDAQLLAVDLAEIRRPSKISSWMWSIISGVVTVFGRPGQGASQVEKSPRLNWATQFLTVAYVGACPPNVSFRMAWILRRLALQEEEKLDDSSRLDVVEIARVARHGSFNLCNKKRLAVQHTNRPLFPMTL